MANTLAIMEAVNLFCGDHDPANSKHLSLDTLKLPDLVEKLVDHAGGGAKMDIDIAVGIQKLEPTFKLKGWDVDLLKQFGKNTRVQNVYTAYGVIRDKRTGRAIEGKAIMHARLSSITSDAFQRGETMGHDHALREVYHYEVYYDGEEIIYFDYWTNTMRIGGQDQDADTNRILRLS